MANTTLLSIGENIRYIHHLSDLHIRKTTERQDEYRYVLNNLCDAIEKYKNNSLIVICGDIFHEKNNFNDISVNLFNLYFDKLSDLCPIIVILGNHDGYTLRDNKRDCLKPLMGRSSGKYKVHYLDQSGIYQYNNIYFGVSSELDKQEIKASDIKLKDNDKEIKIALYHGQVAGSQLDNCTFIKERYDKTLEFFEGYNYALLGDIHKHQYLNETKTIAYCGSLIQQSFGEDPIKHGYIRWNLSKSRSKYVKIENKYMFYKLRLEKGKQTVLEDEIQDKIIQLKVSYKDYTEEECDKQIDELFKDRDCIFHSIKKDKIIDQLELGEGTRLDELDGGYYNLENQNKIIREFMNDKDNKIIADSTLEITEELINNILDKNTKYYNDLETKIKNSYINFELIEMKFSNLFAYGEDNYIDFRKTNGVCGLMANNGYGKSSIIDIILYTLYEDTTKKSINGKLKISDMLNEQSNYFSVLLKIKVNNDIYLIKKYMKTTKKDSSRAGSVEVNLLKLVNDDFKLITSKDTNETKQLIEELVGDSKSFILTNALLQESRLFIDLSKSEKMSYIMGLFDIDIFTNLSKKAYESIKKINEIIKYDKTNMNQHESKEELLNKIKKNKEQIKNLETDINNEKNNIKLKNDLINDNHKKMHTIDQDDFNKICKLEEINEELTIKINSKQEKIEKRTNKIKPIKELSDEEIEEIEINNNNLIKENKNKIKVLQEENEVLIKSLNKIDLIDIDELLIQKQKLQDKITKVNDFIKTLKYEDLIEPEYNLDNEQKCKEYKNLNEKLDELNNNLNILTTTLQEASNASEQYQKLEYDQNCKYCISNPFTKEALTKIKTINDLNIQKTTYEKEKEQILKLEKQNEPFKDYINNYNNELNEYNKNERIHENYNNKQNELKILNERLEMIKQKIIKYEEIKEIKIKNEEIEQKIKINKDQIEELTEYKNEEYLDMMKNLKIKNKNLKYENDCNKLNLEIINLNDQLKENLLKIQNKEEIKELILKNQQLDEEVRVNKNDINNLEKYIEEKQKEKNKIIEENIEIKNNIKVIDDIKTKLDKNQKEYDELSLYYQIVGNNGIKFKLMNTVMTILETEINLILLSFGGELGCKIVIDEKSKNQVNFYITKNRKERGARQCCGSERMKLELATRIGLGKISSCTRGGVLFLDEVLSCMDSSSKASLQEILLKMKKHYRSIFLITHNEEIKGECENYLLIEKNKNHSIITNGKPSNNMDLPDKIESINYDIKQEPPIKNKEKIKKIKKLVTDIQDNKKELEIEKQKQKEKQKEIEKQKRKDNYKKNKNKIKEIVI